MIIQSVNLCSILLSFFKSCLPSTRSFSSWSPRRSSAETERKDFWGGLRGESGKVGRGYVLRSPSPKVGDPTKVAAQQEIEVPSPANRCSRTKGWSSLSHKDFCRLSKHHASSHWNKLSHGLFGSCCGWRAVSSSRQEWNARLTSVGRQKHWQLALALAREMRKCHGNGADRWIGSFPGKECQESRWTGMSA